MKVRVILRDRQIIADVAGNATSDTIERHVDFSGDLISWLIEKMDEYNSFLVIKDEEEKKEIGRFVGGSWEYIRVLEEDEDEDEDVTDYTS